GGLLVGGVTAPPLARAPVGLPSRPPPRRRFQEYSGMLAQGLATADLTRSVAREQGSVTIAAMVLGSLLGLALALAGLPLATPTVLTLQLAAASLVSVLVCLLLAMLITGWLARRLPRHANPFDSQGQPCPTCSANQPSLELCRPPSQRSGSSHSPTAPVPTRSSPSEMSTWM